MSVLEMEHSPVGPSAGAQWINCPGSIAVTQHLPDVSSIYADEGTYAHYISELCRIEGKDAIEYKGQVSECGRFTCNQEMIDGVQDFLDFCELYTEDDDEVMIEQRVNYDAWVENGFGTSDHIVLRSGMIPVIDLKYGKGVPVAAKNNVQGRLYALGVLQEYDDDYDIDGFLIGISQPRINGFRDVWKVSRDELIDWANEVVEPAAERVYAAVAVYEDLELEGTDFETEPFPVSHPEYFAAGDHCRWCKIREGCPVRAGWMRQQALIGMEDVSDDDLDDEDDIFADDKPVTSHANSLTNEQLGEAKNVLEEMRKWCNDIEVLVEKRVAASELILSGYDDEGEPEYYKFCEGRSNRVWRSEEDAIAAMKRARLKVDDYAPRKLITAPAAETLVGKKHKMFKIVKGVPPLIKKPQGKPVLVPGSDSRNPYKVAVNEMEDVPDEDTDVEEDEDIFSDDADDDSWLDD